MREGFQITKNKHYEQTLSHRQMRVGT